MESAPPPGTPIPNFGTRIVNILRYNGRGIIGSIPMVLIPLILAIPPDDLKTKPEKTVLLIWIMAFLCLLIHPLKVPAIAYLPTFAFPILHVVDSKQISKVFMCENTALFVIGGYLRYLLNISGVDKRFMLWILFRDETTKVTTNSLIIKASVAAYFLSMVSNRLIVVPLIMKEVVAPLINLQGSIEQGEADYTKLRYILANAVVSSSVIGSISIVNGANNLMFMRSLWETSKHPDTFNFIDYSCFALPVCFVMFILNLCYHLGLIKIILKNPFSSEKMSEYQKTVLTARSSIPSKMSLHEMQTIFISILLHLTYMSRWGNVTKKIIKTRGWADKASSLLKDGKTIIPDVTVSAIYLLISALLPMSFNFIKIFFAKHRSDLPKAQPDSAIIFWKIVDKGTNYGYMFLLGSFTALNFAVVKSELPAKQLHGIFKSLVSAPMPILLLIWCFVCLLLCNLMTASAASGMLCILILNCIDPSLGLEKKHYLLLLATGMGTSFCFASQFRNTPSSFANSIAKVPLSIQIKYSLGSLVICFIILWVTVAFYAPLIFEPEI